MFYKSSARSKATPRRGTTITNAASKPRCNSW
jgi:hypothetical protein